jgi:hypothetical protein
MPFVAMASSFVMRSPAERMGPRVACIDELAMILMSRRCNAKGTVRRADLGACPLMGVEPEFPCPTLVSSRTSLLCAMTRTAAASAWSGRTRNFTLRVVRQFGEALQARPQEETDAAFLPRPLWSLA